MATIASGIICAWPSTAATIPSGWTRETGLDAKYIQGAAAGADADLVSSFGAANHNHTSPSHTPVQNSHTHTFSAATHTPSLRPNLSEDIREPAGTHGHNAVTSASATATNNGIAITVDSTSNDPAFKAVIWIKSDGTPTGFPVNSYGFFASDTLPTLWTRVQGNTYLKGAAADGDGGGTGGLNTHTHTSPAHTHTQNAHSHASTSSSGPNTGAPFIDAFTQTQSYANETHTHPVTLSNQTATNQSVTTTIDSANHEPVFKKLNIINNGNAGVDFPDQIIALWGGTNASIPTDWARFTSMDGNFVKGANADGESNVTTGGSTTHTHTASNCQPTQDAHNHTTSVGSVSGTIAATGQLSFKGGARGAVNTHTHTWTVNNTTATNQSISVTIDANSSESAYPVYGKVIFIQWTEPSLAVFPPMKMMMGMGV